MQPLSANQIYQIAELSLTESSPSEIAKQVGCTRQAIWKRLAKGETKKLIEIIQKDFIHECLPAAADNITGVIQDGKEIPSQRFRASERVLESAGVLNTQAPSIYVQQIFSSTSITLSPILQGVIAGHLKSMDEGDVIDVHPSDTHDDMATEAILDAHTGDTYNPDISDPSNGEEK